MLLSINPEHVESILSGRKQFEFRKVRCKSDVDKIVIYCTAPQKMVVAEADIEEIIEDEVIEVWRQTKKLAGISYTFFRQYYKGKKKAVAYKLSNVKAYKEPRRLSDYGLSYAPQSFVYLETPVLYM
jgi:predicted transcriptional regulator